MAKTTKKATAGMTSKAPAKKTTIKTSKNEMVAAPRKGTTAYAKYEYDKAKKGGAAKTAAKLTKPVKVGSEPAYKFLQDGAVGASRAKKAIYESAGVGSAKQVKSQILNDLSKTAMRAKMIESRIKAKKKK